MACDWCPSVMYNDWRQQWHNNFCNYITVNKRLEHESNKFEKIKVLTKYSQVLWKSLSAKPCQVVTAFHLQ